MAITREEAIRRLDQIRVEIDSLAEAIRRDWQETPPRDATEVFLSKCRGWEDDRTPAEIVADIYAARTSSDRAADAFTGERDG